jgi:hypothetical protein
MNATTMSVGGSVLWSARSIPLSYAKHSPGLVPWTPPPQTVPVESQLEARALKFVLSHPGVRAVHAQPFTLPFDDDGEPAHYTPDLLVVFDHVPRVLRRMGFDRWTVIEVKPARLCGRAVDVRLAAVHAQLGLRAVALSERDIVGGEG